MNSPEKVRAMLGAMSLGLGFPLLVGPGGVLRLPVEPHPKDRNYGPKGKKGSRKNGGRKFKKK